MAQNPDTKARLHSGGPEGAGFPENNDSALRSSDDSCPLELIQRNDSHQRDAGHGKHGPSVLRVMGGTPQGKIPANIDPGPDGKPNESHKLLFDQNPGQVKWTQTADRKRSEKNMDRVSKKTYNMQRADAQSRNLAGLILMNNLALAGEDVRQADPREASS